MYLIIPGQEKIFFCTKKGFYLKGILDDINEEGRSFVDFKYKHMMKSGAPLTNSESCTVCLPIEFHGFTSRMNSKGYHSLAPGLISICLETVWVPLNVYMYYMPQNHPCMTINRVY